MASRCCSCTRRISAVRWSNWNRPETPRMDIVSAVVVYVLLWWFGFFLALPIGVQVPDESEVGRGHARSAPRRPYLLRKMLAATLIAAGLLIVALGRASCRERVCQYV